MFVNRRLANKTKGDKRKMNFKKPTRKADVAGFTVLVKRVVFAGRPSPESCSPPKDDGQLVYRIFIAADQVGNGELPKVLELARGHAIETPELFFAAL